MTRVPRRRPRIEVVSIYAALSLLGIFAGCYEPASERLTCDDVLPEGSYDFSQIQALVQDPDKGCLDAPCHSAETQREGIRLDTPDLVYDEFSHRPDKYYAVLAAGIMPEPEDGRVRWSEDDLKVLRSWYCNGAFPP